MSDAQISLEDWLATQPERVRLDPLWRNESYRLAAYLQAVTWDECHRLSRHPVTSLVAPQLYKAIGSISACFSEGYSRGTGRDRARFYEYALGSSRESVSWYRSALPVLGRSLSEARQDQLQLIVQHLLVTIPRERHRGRF